MSLAGSQPTPSEAAGPIAATAVLDQRPFQKADTPAQESHLNVVLHEKWLCCLVRLFVGIGESGINLTASRRRFQLDSLRADPYLWIRSNRSSRLCVTSFTQQSTIATASTPRR